MRHAKSADRRRPYGTLLRDSTVFHRRGCRCTTPFNLGFRQPFSENWISAFFVISAQDDASHTLPPNDRLAQKALVALTGLVLLKRLTAYLPLFPFYCHLCFHCVLLFCLFPPAFQVEHSKPGSSLFNISACLRKYDRYWNLFQANHFILWPAGSPPFTVRQFAVPSDLVSSGFKKEL